MAGQLEDSLRQAQQALAVVALLGYHTVGIDVVGHPTRTVIDRDAAGGVVVGHGLAIAAAGDVATETEIVMTDAELAQQRGGKVALVTKAVNDHRLTDGTTYPNHGDMVVEARGLIDALIAIAVVRKNDHQGITPGRCLLPIVDKTTDALIQIVEGIVHLVVKDLRGDVPRLVAGQREQGLHPRLVRLLFLDIGQERIEHDIIAYTPLTKQSQGQVFD